MQLWRTRAAAAGALLTSAGVARAQSLADPSAETRDRLPVEVNLRPAFCSTASELEQEVTRRSPRVHFTLPAGREPRQVWIDVPDPETASGGGQVGARLVMRTPAAGELRRDLWAKSCDELVRAVGFVISVTYDPPSPEPAALETPPVSAAPPAPGAERRSTDAGSAAEAPDRALTSTARPPLAAPVVTRWRAGLGGSAVLGIAPEVLWGATGFAAMSWGPERGLGGAVRIGVAADVGQRAAFSAGSATFGRLSGQLAVGPEWHWHSAHLGLFATGRAGVIYAAGRNTTDPQSYDRPWADVGGSLLGRIELAPGWNLEPELAFCRVLTPYAFQFDPVVVHRVSTWLGQGVVAVSVAF